MKRIFDWRIDLIGICVVALAAASALAGVKDLLTTATENIDWHVSDAKGDVTQLRITSVEGDVPARRLPDAAGTK